MEHAAHPATHPAAHQTGRRRAAWLKTLHRWHWISAAIVLIGLLLFAITGITLNHAGDIKSQARVTTLERQLPGGLLAVLSAAAPQNQESGPANAPLPRAVADRLADDLGISLSGGRADKAEWSADEVYLPLPRPGGDAWLRIDRASGGVEYELTDRGWLSYFNDLHKGRNTGAAWSFFIDLFAVACILSSVTGLLILQYHAGQRPGTWPLVALGLVLPLLLAILFIH